MSRAFTGRHKILARYRSYHGATAGSMTLTGDPRRWANEPGIPGVVRVLDPYHGIQRGWESAETALATLEEIIQLEGPATIAACTASAGHSRSIGPTSRSRSQGRTTLSDW